MDRPTFIRSEYSLYLCLQAESLISDIGGQFGLWMGISLVSIAEYLELFAKMVHTGFRKMKAAARVETAK